MLRNLLIAAIAACFAAKIAAECPNACSAHGKCGAYDMCVCYRNWAANDCSERVCQFGVAHVDTPKGDLDSSSGALSGPGVTVVTNSDLYPFGTTEQFPNMANSDGTVIDNTAHYYMECSNKGVCDRATGTCNCIEGYDGSACQRASCPTTSTGVCSGHGTCESIKTLASWDSNNIYDLWDEDSTMGCNCDGGYSGPDCSERICKYGYDPLYSDDPQSNVRFTNITYQIYTKTTDTLTSSVVLTGNYSIVFTDKTGEDWMTQPIPINTNCDGLTKILEALPNNVIPSGSVLCYQHNKYSPANTPIYDGKLCIGGYCPGSAATTTTSGVAAGGTIAGGWASGTTFTGIPKFTLAFPSNPGYLPQLKITKYLDGTRPTLFSSETKSTLGWHIYTNGFNGEDTDLVPDYCPGVLVNLAGYSATTTGYTTVPFTTKLTGMSVQEVKALKTCLGDSDGDSTNNVEVYNWDYGFGVAVSSITSTGASPQTAAITGVPPVVGGTSVVGAWGPPVQIAYPNTYAYNNFQNPHLIKLVDATTTAPYYASNAQQGFVSDPETYPYPKTLLCSSQSAADAWQGTYPTTGWCANRFQPGFYAVIYYDGVSFNLFTAPDQDYSSTTNFYVFTTTGFLRRVSPIINTFTFSGADQEDTIIDKLHSNIIEFENTTSLVGSYWGQVDCETNPIGTNGAADCINKGDYVMLLNVDLANPTISAAGTITQLQSAAGAYVASAQDARGYYTNPYYPNIYRVKKIFRAPKDPSTNAVNSEKIRHQMVLDYGINAAYGHTIWTSGTDYQTGTTGFTGGKDIGGSGKSYGTVTAALYKFHPPAGYNYVGQCSNRGLCNSNGVCECFHGYTGDDCSVQNALSA